MLWVYVVAVVVVPLAGPQGEGAAVAGLGLGELALQQAGLGEQGPGIGVAGVGADGLAESGLGLRVLVGLVVPPARGEQTMTATPTQPTTGLSPTAPMPCAFRIGAAIRATTPRRNAMPTIRVLPRSAGSGCRLRAGSPRRMTRWRTKNPPRST